MNCAFPSIILSFLVPFIDFSNSLENASLIVLSFVSVNTSLRNNSCIRLICCFKSLLIFLPKLKLFFLLSQDHQLLY
jgi:hypothetical protein